MKHKTFLSDYKDNVRWTRVSGPVTITYKFRPWWKRLLFAIIRLKPYKQTAGSGDYIFVLPSAEQTPGARYQEQA